MSIYHREMRLLGGSAYLLQIIRIMISNFTPYLCFNPSSPRGGVQTIFAIVLKNAQQRGKLLFILAKKIRTYHLPQGRVSFQSSEVRGLVQSHDFTICLFWKYLKWYEVKTLFARWNWHFLIYLEKKKKKTWKSLVSMIFTQKSTFAYILHTICQFLNFQGRDPLM